MNVLQRSVDSALESSSKFSAQNRRSSVINEASKKWVYSVDAAFRQQSSQAPKANESQPPANR